MSTPLLLLLACGAPPTATGPVETAAEPAAVGTHPIQPLTATTGLDTRVVALGDKLFHDRALSVDGTLACAGCHNLETCGVDRLPTSVGVRGAVGPINAPTVFNSSLNLVQFWNGRAATLEEQAGGPLTAAGEMANSWPQALETLTRDPEYPTKFAEVYADGISEANVRDAIATFERSLVTTNAPFDRYLRGDPSAISAAAIAGYENFQEFGCTACHQGAGVGGNMFQKFGVMGDYFADRGHETEVDQGRFLVTGDEADRHVFKVPSLRNVACTGPYFHDASAATLDQAVRTMARYQLGRDMSDSEVAEIVAFLQTLTGEYHGEPL